MHPYIQTLLRGIALEEKEQQERFRLDQQHSLRQLKAEGLALHPIRIVNKYFGYADYPEFRFRLPYPADTQSFRDGMAIELFSEGEEPVKGVLLSLEGMTGECRLFAPDYPDWLEDGSAGLKLAPDTRTTEIMRESLETLEKTRAWRLFQAIHEDHPYPAQGVPANDPVTHWYNPSLDESQQEAVRRICANEDTCIIHGPPGTGKTTTLVEATRQLVARGKRVLVSAPSNTATDHLCLGLVAAGVRVLRVGNAVKVAEALQAHTPEGRLKEHASQKEIKALRKRAEEFRRMALKYKRNFGKDEREQRKLLFQEVKSIRNEIRKLRQYEEEKLFREAQVIAATPIGLHDAGLRNWEADTLIIDEAGQCLEPLAWTIIPLAEKLVLAGDPFQLPPTVLSRDAVKNGLDRSILEIAMDRIPAVSLLQTQYRMRAVIAGFSNAWFYQNQLRTAASLSNRDVHLYFVDTAGTGMEEKAGPDGSSLQNEGELGLVEKLLAHYPLDRAQTALISPYAAQVSAARSAMPASMTVRTIDSFQGQEARHIIVSLVRSNDEGVIGFLNDYRRMNVAMTRAQETLVVIGDSATIGRDPFYEAFLAYVEAHGQYVSAWEFMD